MKRFLLPCVLFISLAAHAQTETEIRAYYDNVNKQVQDALKHGAEGGLYNNQWISNKTGTSWPGVGIYGDTTDFWYDDPPDHIDTSERDPRKVLLKVTERSKAAADLSTYHEFLYKEGKLLFYYAYDLFGNDRWETRAWFNNKGFLFKSSVKFSGKELTEKDLVSDQYKDRKPDAKIISGAAKKFQGLFVKSML
jgi:hypothetical protein